MIGSNLKRVRLQKVSRSRGCYSDSLDRSYVCRIEKGNARVTFNLLKQLVLGLK